MCTICTVCTVHGQWLPTQLRVSNITHRETATHSTTCHCVCKVNMISTQQWLLLVIVGNPLEFYSPGYQVAT